jgi:predicted  nucleic acid-binding Zn-ribbon protein
MIVPEVDITIRVYMCFRCGHLWEKRKDKKPTTCPNCTSPYWDTKPKDERKLLPLKFHGEEVINSNFKEVMKGSK